MSQRPSQPRRLKFTAINHHLNGKCRTWEDAPEVLHFPIWESFGPVVAISECLGFA